MNTFRPVELLAVHYAPLPEERSRVGRLARKDGLILFEYDAAFLASRLELSPFRLPARPGLFEGDPRLFDGLMGLFEDSLPDGWGRLLLDRRMAREGIPSRALGPLDRLAWVGSRAMGALSYEPELGVEAPTVISLDEIARETQAVLAGADADDLEKLIALGGSPQGARPKALVQLSPDGKQLLYGAGALREGYTPWLVKFAARNDDASTGVLEHAYALMARAAGIDMPQTAMLGRTRRHPGWFAARRFDRDGQRRVHVHTLSGLLHAPHDVPSITYRDLLLATRQLTRNEVDVAEMFRRACFNVFAHNRDDHPRNFAFRMDARGEWSASPAYDLTFSSGPGGEHAMLVGREGRAPTVEHLLALGAEVGLKRPERYVDEVRAAVSRFARYADKAGVPSRVRDRVAKRLAELTRSRSAPRRPVAKGKRPTRSR